ncbi:MAG: DUF1376 domain-containing protein [Candidatus Liberibacter ctenarytainae]|uniref:DUF1376 domain-containing protein n=1 Tax=Candidatus Liberibacter ctenarytainae TaxID=2020335 RepID=A0A937DL74_9HYPH|nr:DUF1376 domain-containing protein [Candidatus Liberibacter ctenarytainae]
MNNRPWYKRYPADFISGVLGLTLEQKGAYSIILDLMYDRGGSVPDDDKYIAGVCGCSIRKWRSIRLSLEKANKISIQQGYIHNKRVEKELIKAMKAAEERQENGRKGGVKSAQMRSLSNKNNDLFQEILESAHTYQKPETINRLSKYPSWKKNQISSEKYHDSITVNDPAQINEEHWKKRLIWAHRDGIWPSDWGPSPGQKGCCVPPSLLKNSDLSSLS